MLELPDNVRDQINNLVPSSIIDDIACFVFYDNHPRDRRKIDITICTYKGEIKEYFQREQVSSSNIVGEPLKIKIFRNSNCELFYLVSVINGLTILTTKEGLYLERQFHNVHRCELEDSACRGIAYIHIYKHDDAIPIILDDNLETVEYSTIKSVSREEKPFPIITQLTRKLSEAKYCTKYNENTYKKISAYRKVATHIVLEETRSRSDDSVFSKNFANKNSAMILKSRTPWVIMCNQKLVIKLDVISKCERPINYIHILLHGTTRPSIVYVTKVFHKMNTSPFWFESEIQVVHPDEEVAVVAVVDLNEFKHNITSKIEFNGVLSSNIDGKECTLPFDNICISTVDTMEEKFNALYNTEISERDLILTLLATTEGIDLNLSYIKKQNDPNLSMLHLFCMYLHMEQVKNSENVIIYKKSPYHPLNGIMLIFEENEESTENQPVKVSVHARSPTQVLSLIHYIHDAISYRIVVTTTKYIMIAQNDELSCYNSTVPKEPRRKFQSKDYALCTLRQSSLIIDYLEKCRNKNLDESNRSGHIDLFAMGVNNYVEFRNRILNESLNSINCIISDDSDVEMESEID